jgi:hypothetical protein
VPPAVDVTALPTLTSVNSMPYIVDNTATRQTGPVEQQAACQQPVMDNPRNFDAEPPAQRRLQIRQAQQYATGRG